MYCCMLPLMSEQQEQIQRLVAMFERNHALRLAFIGDHEIVLGEPLHQVLTSVTCTSTRTSATPVLNTGCPHPGRGEALG